MKNTLLRKAIVSSLSGLALALAAPASAAAFSFDGGPGGAGTDWNTVANWDPDGPFTTSLALVDDDLSVGGSFSTNSTTNVFIGDSPSGSLLVNTTGTLDFDVLLLVGENGTGTVTQNNGAVNADVGLLIAHLPGSVGDYNMNGGTFTSGNWLQLADRGAGTVTQTNGTVTINGWTVLGNQNAAAFGTYTISGGEANFVGGADTNNSATFALGVGTGGVAGAAGRFEVVGTGGTINVSDQLRVDGDSFMKWTMDATGVSPINVDGAVTLVSGATLELDFTALPGPIGNIPLINVGGVATASGNFANATEGTTYLGGQYTLTYAGGDGNDIVLVDGGTPVNSFTATPNTIDPGGMSTLAWTVPVTASVEIDQEIGNVDGITTDGTGSIEVTPAATTTYTLTVTDGGEVDQLQATVSLLVPNTFAYTGGAGGLGTNWNDTSNWEPNTIASTTRIDEALIMEAGRALSSEHIFIGDTTTGSLLVGGTAMLQLTNAVLFVGETGEGTVTQNGGDVIVDIGLNVAHLPGSVGTYNMNGGSLATGEWLQLADRGTGALNQTGGVVTINTWTVLGNQNAAAFGTYSISGGEANFVGGGSVPVTTYALGVGTGTVAGTTGRFEVVGSAGTVNVGGELRVDGDSFLRFEMGAGGVSPLNVAGEVTLVAGSTLELDFSSLSGAFGDITLINKTSEGPITGSFDLAPEGTFFGSFLLTYEGGDGNDLVLQRGLGSQFTEISYARGTDELTLKWDSKTAKLYNLRSEVDPSAAPPADWPIFAPHQDIAATPPENTLVISLPADPFRLFVIEEFNAPPVSLVSDDFESGAGDWTTGSDGLGGTAWELGTPTVVGPPAANSPTNCFGTNLAADYGFDANIWLRSPSADLTNADGATVRYFQYFEIETGFDLGTVSVLDADDDSVLAVLVPVVDDSSAGWEEVSMPLPAAALGKNVVIEFRLDTDDVTNEAGWYIDDFNLTVP